MSHLHLIHLILLRHLDANKEHGCCDGKQRCHVCRRPHVNLRRRKDFLASAGDAGEGNVGADDAECQEDDDDHVNPAFWQTELT